MRTALAGTMLVGALAGAAPLAAQVEAAVIIHEGPVAVAARIGHPDLHRAPYVVRGGYVVAWGNRVARVIRVQPVRYSGHHWWKRYGYRPTTLWFDGYRFYDRPFRRYDLREVLVFERRGHYVMAGDFYRTHRYLGDEPWYFDDDYHDRGRRHDHRRGDWGD